MQTPAHLRRLSRVRSMRAVAQLSPAAFPGSHCPLHTALTQAARIPGLSSIVVGTPECGYYSRNIPAAAAQGSTDFHWTYVLDSREIVFGCRKGLTQAILEMDRAGARAILLIATCIPDLIGEDLESLCTELQPRVQAVLLHVALGNFKFGGPAAGSRETILALRRLIRREAGDGALQILGRNQGGPAFLPELLPQLEAQGVPVRCLGPASPLEDFEQAGRASLNLVVSPAFADLGRWMEQELQIPAVFLHELYSAAELQAACSRVASLCGLAAVPDSAGFAALSRLEAQAADSLAGLRYVSAGLGTLQPLPLAVYLRRLGMSPLLLQLDDCSTADAGWRAKLLELGEDPPVCLLLHPQADWQQICALQPDFVLTDRTALPGEPPAVRVSDLQMQAGTARSICLLERLLCLRKEENCHGTV